ncbi:hypothetical protein KY285_013133 [Solanum tuberosum]|nr:hypothetical protein KY285_013133 [Solanum tuberosum]
MEYQIDRCIQALESVPQEKRQSQYECLKGRLYNAIPDVYNEEAECHLLKALEAWDSLGLCVSKKGDYKRAKKCYKFVLNMDKGNSIVLRRLADLELMLAQSEYILGCAYFTSFLLTGGWDHSNLQLALEAYKKALEIDAVKSHPFLHYDCGLVNRYLENYKGFLIGFSDVASKNPASDALHQLTLMLQLLDKLEGLLQGKLNDKSNDKSKGKSMETSLSSLIQSLATIDFEVMCFLAVDPSYTRATMDLLTEGLNEGIAVIGAVRCLVKYEYKAPS